MSFTKEAFGGKNSLKRVVIPYRPPSLQEHLAEAKKKRRKIQVSVARIASVTLAAATVVSVAGYASGRVDSDDFSDVYEHFAHKSLTNDQKKAAQVFASDELSQGHLVSNIQIEGEDVNGKKAAYLRSQPIAPNSLDGIIVGDYVGDAEIGSTIAKALVVLGNNSDRKYENDPKHSYWLTYPDPKNPNRFLFLSVNEIDLNSRVAARAVTPVDLSKLP